MEKRIRAGKGSDVFLGISFTTSVISIMGGKVKFISKSDVFIEFS
jgi:hypothetical protein